MTSATPESDGDDNGRAVVVVTAILVLELNGEHLSFDSRTTMVKVLLHA